MKIQGKARQELNIAAADRRAELLTPAQAQDVARWMVTETQAVFQRGLIKDYALTHDPLYTPDLATATLKGYCGLAQSFIDMTLRDCGFVSRPVAMQTLPHGGFPHVALAAEFETKQGRKLFLFDPSFRQFCTGEKGEPGEILAGLPGGKELRAELLANGFSELNPEKAFSYLSAFHNGQPPVASHASAMKFFAKPRESNMNRWFSRENLIDRGLIDPQARPRPPLP